MELDPGFGIPQPQTQAIAGWEAASLGPGMRCQEQHLPKNGNMQLHDRTTRWQSVSAHRRGWGGRHRGVVKLQKRVSDSVTDELLGLWLEIQARSRFCGA